VGGDTPAPRQGTSSPAPLVYEWIPGKGERGKSQKTGRDASRLLDRGGIAVPFRLDGGGVCMPRSSLVAIAVIAAYGMTKPMGNTLDPLFLCGDSEPSRRSYHDPPNMGAHCRKPLWHYCPHQVARLETEIASLSLPMASREAKVVGIAHLAPAVAVCSDEQREHTFCGELRWRRCPNARRVKPVRFWQTSHAPVVFGPSTRARFQRKPCPLQAPE
jgi:hypothetical protein